MGRALILSLVAVLVVGVLPASAGPDTPRRDIAPQPAPRHDEDFSGAAFVEPIARSLKHPVLTTSLVRVAQSAREGGRAAALGEAREAGVTVNNDRVRV